jgi:hypothetical protein
MAKAPKEIVTTLRVKTEIDGMSLRAITRLRWASRILTGLAGLAAILVAADVGPAVHRWAALAVAVLGYGATWCAQQLPAAPKGGRPPGSPPPAAVLAIGLLVLAPACAPGTYQQGLQYTAYLAAARDAGAVELLTRATATHKRCLAQHGANGAAYEACSRQEYQAVAGWLAAGRILCRTDGPLQGLLVEMRAAGAGK